MAPERCGHHHPYMGVVIYLNQKGSTIPAVFLPDFMGSSGSGRVHVYGVVGDGEHSHAQALILYLVLLHLRVGHPQRNHARLEVILALRKKKPHISF